MAWRDSLVRIADYQVEQLQLRLAEVVDRRLKAELRLAMLHAEIEAETASASADVEAGWYRLGYLEGWRARRDSAIADIAGVQAEEAGVRDALAQAFEELKKFEQLKENADLAQRKVDARIEANLMDELGSRRAAAR
jgi:flagellar FliJ protein